MTLDKNRIREFINIVGDMEETTKTLEELPDIEPYTQEDIDLIDKIRITALLLNQMAQACLDTFSGKQSC